MTLRSSHRQSVPVADLALRFEVDAQDIRVTDVQDNRDGQPAFEVEVSQGGTRVTVWPGAAEVDSDPYRLIVEFEENDYLTRLGDGKLIVKGETVQALPVARTPLARRQPYHYTNLAREA
jgi:hypothetical protein